MAVAGDDPLEAERLADVGQRHLDRAGQYVTEADDIAEVLSQPIDASPVDFLARLLQLAYSVTGTSDPVELEQSGAQRARSLFALGGRPAEVLPGHGVQTAVFTVLADLILDGDQFVGVTRTVYSALRSKPQRLVALLSDERLRMDLTEAIDHLMYGSLQASLISAATVPDRVHLAAALELARTVVEGPGKRLVAAFLAVTTKTPYERQRTKDASALVSAAMSRPGGDAWAGLGLALRHASAHLDFRVEDRGNVLVLSPDSPRPLRLAGPEFIDRLLAGIETIYAALLAVQVAAADSGVDVLGTRGLAVLDLGPLDTVAFALRFWGWHVHQVEISEDALTLSVEATVMPDTPVITALATALQIQLPTEIEQVTITLREQTDADRAGRTHQLRGPVQAWRDFHEPATDKVRGLVEIAASWRFDGYPTMPYTAARQWIAVQAGAAVGMGFPHGVTPLRSLRDLARRFQDENLVRTLTSAITVVRCRASDAGMDHHVTTDLDLLHQWATTRLPKAARSSVITLDQLRTARELCERDLPESGTCV
ncbi:hypothetical protein GCM10029964_089080 [Kibdelosporangium lantanae]